VERFSCFFNYGGRLVQPEPVPDVRNILHPLARKSPIPGLGLEDVVVRAPVETAPPRCNIDVLQFL
jgi:hypothetical protein